MTDNPSGVSGPPVARDARSEGFFDAAGRDVLAIRRCTSCGHLLAPESRTCTDCGSSGLEWHTSSGAAELVTWSVIHHPPHPGFAEQVPFAVAYVELAEGPWINARLIGISLEDLHAGLPLSVAFVHPAEGDSYPVFGPRVVEAEST